MFEIADLVTLKPDDEGILTGSDYSVLDGTEPRYRSLLGISNGSDDAAILQAVGTNQAYFKIHRSKAGFPLVLPYSSKGLDFGKPIEVADVDTQTHLYDYQSVSGGSTNIEDLFVIDKYPPGTYSLSGIWHLTVDESTTLVGPNHDNDLAFRSVASTTVSYSSSMDVTFHVTHQVDRRLKVTEFSIMYQFHLNGTSAKFLPPKFDEGRTPKGTLWDDDANHPDGDFIVTNNQDGLVVTGTVYQAYPDTGGIAVPWANILSNGHLYHPQDGANRHSDLGRLQKCDLRTTLRDLTEIACRTSRRRNTQDLPGHRYVDVFPTP